MGPGKVIYQDGKVLCVRNGFTNCIIQLSVNRVCRLGEEYPKFGENDNTESDTQSSADTSEWLGDSDGMVDNPKVSYSG